MVTEIAQIDVKPGMEERIRARRAKGAGDFRARQGFSHPGAARSIEKPQRYRLMIQWDTLENHIVDFYGSDDWKAWRALVGHCFAGPPEVEHTNTVLPAA